MWLCVIEFPDAQCDPGFRLPLRPPALPPSVRRLPMVKSHVKKDSLFQKYIFFGFIYAILRLCSKITQFKVIFATTECPTQIDSPQTFLMPLASAQSTRLGSVPVSLWAFSLQWDSTVRLQQIWGTFSV